MYLFSIDRNKYSFIEADNENFRYTGRVDFTNEKAPAIIYAGSMIFTKFEGTSLKIAIRNHHCCYENSIGYILDGNIHGKVVIPNNNKCIVINIMNGLKDQVHDLVLYKRQDACHYFDFHGLVLDKGCSIREPGPRSKRRIECFGDSIGAGELCELMNEMKKNQLESYKGKLSNGCLSFPLILGRYLGAEVNNNSQGGLALLNGTGYFRRQRCLGLEFTYDKLRYNPELGKCTKWDFKRFIPHVVIIELGHNDAYPSNFINEDEEKKTIWKEKYKDIIKDLRRKYPKALFILITSIAKHDKGWDEALDEIKYDLNDSKVVRYKFIRNGLLSKEYLLVSEAAEMAQELAEFINSFGEDVWK